MYDSDPEQNSHISYSTGQIGRNHVDSSVYIEIARKTLPLPDYSLWIKKLVGDWTKKESDNYFGIHFEADSFIWRKIYFEFEVYQRIFVGAIKILYLTAVSY